MSTTNLHVNSEKSLGIRVFSSSIFVWLLLVGYLVLVKVVILPLFPPIEIDAVAAIFSWNVILIAGFIGLVKHLPIIRLCIQKLRLFIESRDQNQKVRQVFLFCFF